jgi:hypothetical protein
MNLVSNLVFYQPHIFVCSIFLIISGVSLLFTLVGYMEGFTSKYPFIISIIGFVGNSILWLIFMWLAYIVKT